jgi:hypothetical protein
MGGCQLGGDAFGEGPGRVRGVDEQQVAAFGGQTPGYCFADAWGLLVCIVIQ